MPVHYITDRNRGYIEREREDGQTPLTILTPRRHGLEERLRHAVSTLSPGRRDPASVLTSRSPSHAADSKINSLGKEPWPTPSSQIGAMSPNSEVNRTANASRARRRGTTQEDAAHSTEPIQTFHTSRTFWTRLATMTTSNQTTMSSRHQLQEQSHGRSPLVSPHQVHNSPVPTASMQRSPAPSTGALRYLQPGTPSTSTPSPKFTLGSSPSWRSPPPSSASPSNHHTLSSARSSIKPERLCLGSSSPLLRDEEYSLLPSPPSRGPKHSPSPSRLSYQRSRPLSPPSSSDPSPSQPALPRLLIPGSSIPESPLSSPLTPGALDSEPETSTTFWTSKTPSNFWFTSRTNRSASATGPSPSPSPIPAAPAAPSSHPLHSSSSATHDTTWITTLSEGYDILAARNDALAAELGKVSAELTTLRATVNALRPPRDVIKSALALLVRLFVVLVGGRAVVLRLIFIRHQRATDTHEADAEAH